MALSLFLSAQGEPEDLPPLEYSAKQVRGVVVDATTGAPLEGVIVVAQWILFQGGFYYSPDHIVRLQVLETVTDAHGQYVIPGWGPKPNALYPWSKLDKKDPELLFFKQGYKPSGVQNRFERNEAVRISEWDGKTIKLEKFAGTPDEWAQELSNLQIFLAWGWREVMDWRSIPRMALALELERLSLAQRKLKVSNIRGLNAFRTTIEEVRELLGRKK